MTFETICILENLARGEGSDGLDPALGSRMVLQDHHSGWNIFFDLDGLCGFGFNSYLFL